MGKDRVLAFVFIAITFIFAITTIFSMVISRPSANTLPSFPGMYTTTGMASVKPTVKPTIKPTAIATKQSSPTPFPKITVNPLQEQIKIQYSQLLNRCLEELQRRPGYQPIPHEDDKEEHDKWVEDNVKSLNACVEREMKSIGEQRV